VIQCCCSIKAEKALFEDKTDQKNKSLPADTAERPTKGEMGLRGKGSGERGSKIRANQRGKNQKRGNIFYEDKGGLGKGMKALQGNFWKMKGNTGERGFRREGGNPAAGLPLAQPRGTAKQGYKKGSRTIERQGHCREQSMGE